MNQRTAARLTGLGSLFFFGIYLVNVLYARSLSNFQETFPFSVDPLGPQTLVIVLLVMSVFFAATIMIRSGEWAE
jgi:hypothetical protein